MKKFSIGRNFDVLMLLPPIGIRLSILGKKSIVSITLDDIPSEKLFEELCKRKSNLDIYSQDWNIFYLFASITQPYGDDLEAWAIKKFGWNKVKEYSKGDAVTTNSKNIEIKFSHSRLKHLDRSGGPEKRFHFKTLRLKDSVEYFLLIGIDNTDVYTFLLPYLDTQQYLDSQSNLYLRINGRRGSRWWEFMEKYLVDVGPTPTYPASI